MDSTITEFDIPSWHALEGYINGIDRTAWEINAQNVYFGDDKRREDTYQQNGGYGPQGGYPQAPQGYAPQLQYQSPPAYGDQQGYGSAGYGYEQPQQPYY